MVTAAFVGCSDEPTQPNPPATDPSYIDAPPAGQGFQIMTEVTEVPPGVEEQDCYFYRVSDLAAKAGMDPKAPLNLHRVQIAQRPGSHHMNVFRVRTIVDLDPAKGTVQKNQNGTGPCFKSPNWADWPLVANSQIDGQLDWTFPDGVANVLQPDEWIMVQTHYVNATTQKTPDYGQVRINFWHIPTSDVKDELGTLFATKQSIRICQSNPTPSFDGTCQFNSAKPVNIIGANGHFHSRGKVFDMYNWDGKSIDTPPAEQRFYESKAWSEPPMLFAGKDKPPLAEVPAGGGVWYSCSYQWEPPAQSVGCDGLNARDKQGANDCCYTFGPVVDASEHCNAFVYYYPKSDDVNCF
jgi:hypothetical protein